MKVRIRRLDLSVPLPRYATPGAAGFDLASAEERTIGPGEVARIRTGLVVEAPHGYFVAVVARSSTPAARGLIVANGVGVIDSDYSGPDDEIKVLVWNFTADAVRVSRGDRLAQGLLLPVVRAEWEEVDAIRDQSRGGFGATGR